MKILVTGASGLLGLNLSLQAAHAHQVTGVVNSNAIQTDAFRIRQADLMAPGAFEQLVEDTQPDWVIHCAAMANVDQCENAPDIALRLNGDLPGEFASFAAQAGARFVHISTDAVFDGQRGAYTEEDETNPLSVYARTKLAGEQTVMDANPEAIIARVNFYGWSLSGQRSLAEFFFNKLQAGSPMKGFTDVFFCPLVVHDLADILLSMLEKELSGLYHVVSSEHLSKYDFGVAIARQFDFDAGLVAPASVIDGGLKAARSPNLTLDVSKLAADLGQLTPDIASGLSRFHQRYLDNYPQQLRGLQAGN